MTKSENTLSTQESLKALEAYIGSEEFSSMPESVKTAMLGTLDELYGVVSEDTATDTGVAFVNMGDIASLGLSEQKRATLEYLKREASRVMSEDISNADADYKKAMMGIALDLQALLTSIFDAQMEKSKTYNKVLLAQGESIEESMETKIQEMVELVDAQKSAGEKPWWTYLVAAVIAVVGAVISFFTAGAAAALVGLLVTAVMMSPIGDKLTEAIATGIGGSDPNTGASIAATAIVAAISTLLSMGASGFTTAATGAAKAAVTEGAKAAAKEATKGAARAVTYAVAEEVADGAADALNVADDVAAEIGKAGAKAASKLRFDVGAFKAGLGERLVGEYLQGFIGSGGLIQVIQAAMESTEEGKEFLASDAGALTLGALGILVSIGGGFAASKATAGGVKTRYEYLKANGLVDTFGTLSNDWMTALQVIRGAATTAGGVEGVVNYVNFKDIAKLQEALAEVTARNTMETSGQQASFDGQRRMNEHFTKQSKTASESLRVALEAFGTAEGALVSNLAG